MAKLLLQSETQNRTLAAELVTADSMWSRMKGLLGTSKIAQDYALWIKPCNSIHTIFMNYPIDIIFVDHKLQICGLEAGLEPWRMVLPKLKAKSVFEMRCGTIANFKLKIGDQLYVDP
jgi:uncharacterized membrane protein (UPF0127 family)